ncbi:MAG: ABC transporter substrate-binding protein [Bacteroidia bacterium]
MRNLLRVIHIILLFVSCNEHAVTSSLVFRMNMESALNSLDPAFARDQYGIWACSQFYNGLIQLDTAMNPVSAIAGNWEILDSGKLYRFYLRNDVRFHKDACFGEDGDRLVTASDFVWSFQRLLDPALASPGAWIFNDKVEGPSAFKAVNDTTFEIHLLRSFPPLPGLLAMPYCYVISKEAVSYYGNTFRAHPVGTGPFQLKFWEEGIKLVGTRNLDYFEVENGKRLPYLDGFEVGFIESKQTAFMEFVQGKLDFYNGLEGGFKDELLTRNGELKPKYTGKFKLRVGSYLNTEYFGFMVDPKIESDQVNPLIDKNLRKALNFAINREEMMRFLRNNIGIPGNGGFIPQGLPGHRPDIGYAYNPDSARHYLKSSGYEGQELVLYTNKSYLDLTVYVQRMWQQIGVKARIEVNPGPFHREMVSKSKLMCFRGSWLADYPDAENYLSLFYSPNFAPGGPNFTHYTNPEFDDLYRKAMNESDPVLREKYYQKMDVLVMDEAPVVVLFYDQTMQLLSNRMEALPVNAMNHLQLKNARMYAGPVE